MNSGTYHVIELGDQHIHMYGIDKHGCFGKLATYPPLKLPNRLIQCCFQYENHIFIQISSPKFDSIAFSLDPSTDDLTIGIGTCLLRQIVGIDGKLYNVSNRCFTPIDIERSTSGVFGLSASGMLQDRIVSMRMMPLLYNSNCIFSVDILNETPKNFLLMFNDIDAPELVFFKQIYSAKYGRVVTYHAEKHKDNSISYYVDNEWCKTSNVLYSAWSDDVYVQRNERILYINDEMVTLEEYGIVHVYDETIWVHMHHFIGVGAAIEGKLHFFFIYAPCTTMKLYINPFNPLFAITRTANSVQLWWFDKETLRLVPITIFTGHISVGRNSLLRDVQFISMNLFIVQSVVYRFSDGEASVIGSIPVINGKEISDLELFPSKPFLLSAICPSLDGLDIVKHEMIFDEVGTPTTVHKRYSVRDALVNCECLVFSSNNIEDSYITYNPIS
ncbi:hypothetical protein PCE1_000692 [Barthelona sp. PCE]